MHLDSLEKIDSITLSSNFVIFELPKTADFSEILKNAIHIKQNDRGSILKDQIKSIEEILHNKQETALIIVIEHAETMNDEAANAFLKNLEEPKENVHFVFLVNNLSKLLPTIKSRAQYYYLPNNEQTIAPPKLEADRMTLAKAYIQAGASELAAIADKIAKDKKDARGKALELVSDAIEVCYKAFFMTANSSYLQKLDKLIKTDEALRANGNIRLQLIAYML